MGAGQSSGGAGGDNSVQIKTSYYVLLGLERDATDLDIKKAYRRKALELHPDRNHGKEDEATRLFTDVQAAYEVLSDPQERAWYDSHEGAILRGFEDGNDGTSAPDGGSFHYNIKITTSDDISKFVAGVALKRVDYDNVPDKFFTELNTFFETLAKEEATAARMEGADQPDYPSFGVRDDDYEDVVKSFYSAWNGFSTVKTYFWVDKWNLRDAPDRRVKRAMEKENKKERDDAVREFNNAVQTLVGFVRKRDPRYKPNFQTDADRQKALRDAAQAQAARSRRENAKKMEDVDAIPDWAKGQELVEEEEIDWDEELIDEEFECVACRKTFKSEKQFEAHERSKKHQKAVQALKRQMKKENALFNLDDNATGDVASSDTSDEDEDETQHEVEDETGETHISTDQSESPGLETTTNGLSDINLSDKIDSGKKVQGASEQADHPQSSSNSDTDSEPTDDEYATREEVTARLDTTSTTDGQPDPSTPQTTTTASSTPKLGKAAQKRAKRAAKEAASTSIDADSSNDPTKTKCAVCQQGFPSKNALFQHIKQEGHAAPVSVTKTGGSVGKGKRQKGKR